MSSPRRPGDTRDPGTGSFMSIAAAVIGIGGALLYGIYKLAELESPHQFSEQDTIIADTKEKCRAAADIIRRHCDDFGYLGMDCLWTNYSHNRRGKIALLQLATHKGFRLIVRVCSLQSNISTELENILNDESIIKVGVGIDQKAGFLENDWNISVRGMLNLSRLAEHAKVSERKLSSLAKSLCDMDVKKTTALSTVNWNEPNLTPDQHEYAIKRAIASIEVFRKLRHKIISSGCSYDHIERKILIIEINKDSYFGFD